jgi:chloride channel protein, CIC family
MEFVIQPHAPFTGKQIKFLGLPEGCIIVSCTDGKREWVPNANTRLEVHMKITVVIAPDSSGALEILHRGCGTPKNTS